MSEHVDVLILGGGLAGLSAAYHLEDVGRGRVRSLVVEKEDRVGGRAGSVEKDGFTFDHTGHLLHLHDSYGKKLILELLGDNVASHERSTWIHSHGVSTRYPFQANTYGLPPHVIEECAAGFFKKRLRPERLPAQPTFEAWCRATFGEGILRHFMRPYNEKLWTRPLRELTTEWQGRFLPRPKAEEVLYGALVDQKRFFGYNAFFRYPKRGGIQVLPDALAARVPDVRTGMRVTRVDLKAKTAEIDGLGTVRYDRLVNTLPLTSFLDLCGKLPAAVSQAKKKLDWVTVHNLNIGLGRAGISKGHWFYFPEKQFPFYRAGFCSNFSKSLCPPGTSSMYIELSRRPGSKIDRKAMEKASVAALRSSGLIRRSDKVVTKLWIDIGCAYVIYDRWRTPAVGEIASWLKGRKTWSIGRWGGWKYSFMEETILDGRRCAREILGKKVLERRSKGPLTALK